MRSLSYPKSRRLIEHADEVEDIPLTDEDIFRTREEQMKEALDPYSKENMKKFVLEIMGNKHEISARDIPVKEHSDLLASVSSAVYASENGFDIEIQDGYIERNGFLLRDFIIRRK